MIKTLFDRVFSGAALICLMPVFAAISAWVRFGSPGPVFFRQVRVGRHGENFHIYKFRTMYVDAENTGGRITVGCDPRITRQGRFLRKYKLDELPQLINVWRGEMSIVGPRPEVPEYMKCYPDELRRIVLSVRPGITDLASIEFRNENELIGRSEDPENFYINSILPIKQRYYFEYVQNHSFAGDIRIITKTIKAIFK